MLRESECGLGKPSTPSRSVRVRGRPKPGAGEVVGRQNPQKHPPWGQTPSSPGWPGCPGPCGSVVQQSGWGRHRREKPSLRLPQQGSRQGPAQPRLWKGGRGPTQHRYSAGSEHRDAEMDLAPRSAAQVCPRQRGDGS